MRKEAGWQREISCHHHLHGNPAGRLIQSWPGASGQQQQRQTGQQANLQEAGDVAANRDVGSKKNPHKASAWWARSFGEAGSTMIEPGGASAKPNPRFGRDRGQETNLEAGGEIPPNKSGKGSRVPRPGTEKVDTDDAHDS